MPISALLAAALALPAAAESPALPAGGDYFFHQGYGYGSQATLNPFSIFLNGSYDMLQTRAMSNRIATLDYAGGSRNVADNLLNPVDNIGKFGWEEFIYSEIIPADPSVKSSQWVPNYSLHMLGGGLTFRTMEEWYRRRGLSHPRALAVANYLLFAYVNETVENGDNRSANVDAIADYLIFNPAGILLFANDDIARFFSRTLHAANWSSLPMLNARTGQLDNTSLSFSYKWFPLSERPVGLFYYTGMNTVLGLTCRYGNGYALSAGGGIGTVGIVEVDQENGQRKSTAVLGKTGALFWDLNNSLLASLIVSNQRLYGVRLNVYPLPSMERWPVKPGFFAARGYGGEIFGGVTLDVTGVGMSYFLR